MALRASNGDPATETFTPVHTVHNRWGASAAQLPGGQVIVFGGNTNPAGGDDHRMQRIELYLP